MNEAAYLFNPLAGLLSHGSSATPLVCRDDALVSTNKDLLDVQVRSGDYLATVATKLDQLSLELASGDCDVKSANLDVMVEGLLYIQQNYNLVKKPTLRENQ